jgi:hypothetical protein
VSFRPRGQQPGELSLWRRFMAWSSKHSLLPLERYAAEAAGIVFLLALHAIMILAVRLMPEEGKELAKALLSLTHLSALWGATIIIISELALLCYKTIASVQWEMQHWKPGHGNDDSTHPQ